MNSAPRIVTVCHCGVCRYEIQRGLAEDKKAKSLAPAFGAFCRNDIQIYKKKLEKGGAESQATLIFRNSSDIARRGSCSICGTSLLMDYEWFEPNTIWLVNPVWLGLNVAELVDPLVDSSTKKNEVSEVPEEVPVEFFYNGGKADLDVCWGHRQNAVNSTSGADAYSLGVVVKKPTDDYQDLSENNDASMMPRGVLQCDDLDFTNFYLDVGSL